MKPALSFKKISVLIIGLLGVSVSITLLFLGMRAVMDVGGYCAEGGPYQIAVHCPKGVAWIMPVSIFVGLGSATLYLVSTVAGGPNIALLFWTGLFGALGWNFLEYGIKPADAGGSIAWLICGIMFEVMAIGPFLFSGKDTLREIFWGGGTSAFPVARIQNAAELSSGQKQFLLLLHCGAIAIGIYAGLLLYNWAAY